MNARFNCSLAKVCACILRICLLALLSWGFITPVIADSDALRLGQVKAAFVLNIARFVEWPNQLKASSQVTICLQHANPMFESMLTIAGETISERQVAINAINHFNNLSHCQIVLVSETELTKFHSEFATDLNQPILTILDSTESPQANTRRTNILVTLVRKGARIGFEINLDKARQVNLRLSSELLKLATIVKDGG